jgi:hypothetical protein
LFWSVWYFTKRRISKPCIFHETGSGAISDNKQASAKNS